MIIPGLFLCTVVLIPLICFLYSCQKRGLARSIVSHFWFFSILWFVSFPFRAVLISFDLIDLQVARLWNWEELAPSVVLSFLFWVSTYLGYVSMEDNRHSKIHTMTENLPSSLRGQTVVLITIILSILFLYKSVFQSGEFKAFIGNEQNEARVGKGWFFLLSELFTLSSVAYLGRVMHVRRTMILSKVDLVIYLVVALLSVLISVAINSRRVMAFLMFTMVVVYSIRGRNRWLLPAFAIIASFLLSPVLQEVRYIDAVGIMSGDISLSESFSIIGQSRHFLTTLSSSFEGVDHLAVYMEKVGWFQLLTGVDGGLSWIYNAILSFLPRTLWVNKPEIYGSVAQQYFLYPEMYASGAAQTTFPPSFVVDFSFGYGVFLGLCLCWILGRFLALMTIALWDNASNAPTKAIALYVFINMFNIVRGGTGFVQSLLMFTVMTGFVLGFRETWLAANAIIKKTIDFRVRSFRRLR